MALDALTAISPLDGRYAQGLAPLGDYFSEYGLIKYRVQVEIRWLAHLAALPEIKELPPLSDRLKNKMMTLAREFSVADARAVKEIEKTTNHDVKAVEYWLKNFFQDDAEASTLREFWHFACTSEDINNVAYALLLKDAGDSLLQPKLAAIADFLRDFAHRTAKVPMLARTHGQPATPTTVGKEMANVAYRLGRQLQELQKRPFLAKMNGAVGNFNAHRVVYPEINWPEVNEHFITSLGLTFNPYTTQIEPHDALAEYFHNLVRVNTILMDLSRDVWGYISLHYFTQKVRAHEVGSSTMPHKVNPIDFENAEGNLGLANALLAHLAGKLPVSRWQRDLSDSTVLRNIGVAVGYGVLAYNSLEKGLNKLEVNESVIARDLDAHWELLAEPIQTVMRRYGINAAYEQLKELTRGKEQVTKEELHAFIRKLTIPEPAKEELLRLTPASYIGFAPELAARI